MDGSLRLTPTSDTTKKEPQARGGWPTWSWRRQGSTVSGGPPAGIRSARHPRTPLPAATSDHLPRLQFHHLPGKLFIQKIKRVSVFCSQRRYHATGFTVGLLCITCHAGCSAPYRLMTVLTGTHGTAVVRSAQRVPETVPLPDGERRTSIHQEQTTNTQSLSAAPSG